MKVRLRTPERKQIEILTASLDELLEAEHQARTVWRVVEGLDLSVWLKEIKSFEGAAGRDSTDPKLLVSLWLYAILDGVGSAREISRLCEQHIAYKWLCGGLSVNYHLLSDFRSKNRDNWESLFVQIVSSLLAKGLVEMTRVAQDGMKVRANAGGCSYRSKNRLKQYRKEVKAQLKALEQQEDEASIEVNKRRKAAQQRALNEREKKIEEALAHCNEVQKVKSSSKRKADRQKKARASTTDADSRKMKFSDGGFRPGYNVQYSTDVDTGIVVGVDCTNEGNDSHQLIPMLEQLEDNYSKTPKEVLVDGGFVTLDVVTETNNTGSTIYAPLVNEQKQIEEGKNPYAKKPKDSPAVAQWRKRMGTDEAKEIYKLRAQTSEWVNARVRNNGLLQMPVRGLAKCKTVAIIYALAHNIMQMQLLL